MLTIATIAARVQDKLEEVRGAGITPAPYMANFWDLVGEIYPAVAEAANEANLIAGSVVVVNTAYVIPPLTTYLPMPANAIALSRVVGPYPVLKSDVFTLDSMLPNWQQIPPEKTIRGWFPVGVTQWGVYPQLIEEQRVVLSYIAVPVAVPRPYTGAEQMPFQQEFEAAIEMYAAHILRLKEGGAEFEMSQADYQGFLDAMQSLSRIQARRDQLIFAKTLGASTGVNPTESR
jgi:hypothetical protein